MPHSYSLTETIYALSSGPGKGGVAVIRVSGKQVHSIMARLTGIKKPIPRHAYFKELKNEFGIVLDHALVLYFNEPYSFTGEDVVEFHVHGGRSVIEAVCDAISGFPQVRPAEPGEFSRRAVVYGKMDLTSAEGLMDLIDAQTEQQRRQALIQMEGRLGSLYESWRKILVHEMAYLEAFIDFPEEDIPHEKLDMIDDKIKELISQICAHLSDNQRGQRLREGFQIAIIGKPNVGKSSLINALSKKDVAIVSQNAGTTRDVVETHLDIDGFPVILADTAGLRSKADEIESEGIKRAVRKAEESDLILHVVDSAKYPQGEKLPLQIQQIPIKTVWNKSDLLKYKNEDNILFVSAKTGAGIEKLWIEIKTFLREKFTPGTDGVITRERYRIALQECVQSLKSALKANSIELKAEDLRLAARAIGRIMGRIDTEELLDVIFRDFCIGK